MEKTTKLLRMLYDAVNEGDISKNWLPCLDAANQEVCDIEAAQLRVNSDSATPNWGRCDYCQNIVDLSKHKHSVTRRAGYACKLCATSHEGSKMNDNKLPGFIYFLWGLSAGIFLMTLISVIIVLFVGLLSGA